MQARFFSLFFLNVVKMFVEDCEIHINTLLELNLLKFAPIDSVGSVVYFPLG